MFRRIDNNVFYENLTNLKKVYKMLYNIVYNYI
jgi:hypothetical protein